MNSIRTFREYIDINEISLQKMENLIILDNEYSIVQEFKKIFKINVKIYTEYVKSGGLCTMNSKTSFNIKYSNKGNLIHELLHVLQFLSQNDTKYKNFTNIDDNTFMEYLLQPKELNNQAISLAFGIHGLNMNTKETLEYKKKITITEKSDLNAKILFIFYRINLFPKDKKYIKKLKGLIQKYVSYIDYLEKTKTKGHLVEQSNTIIDFI